MTDRERYIKQAFRRYKENKCALKRNVEGFSFLFAIDYSRLRVSCSDHGKDGAIIRYIDQKTLIEKQVLIVERTMWFYALDDENGTKCRFIQMLFVKGYKQYRAAMECYIGNTTAVKWKKEILQRGAAVADMFNLW